MAVITARVDDNVKLWLEQFADEVWTSVSGLVNMWAKRVLRTKQMTIGLTDDELEDQEMNANSYQLQQQFQKSLHSGRSALVI